MSHSDPHRQGAVSTQIGNLTVNLSSMDDRGFIERKPETGYTWVSLRYTIVCLLIGVARSSVSEWVARKIVTIRPNRWLRQMEGSRCRISMVFRFRVSKPFPGYRVPSKPDMVSLKCMRCHSVFNTWVLEERKYHPHQTGIPPASSPPNIALNCWIRELQINGLCSMSRLVGPGERSEPEIFFINSLIPSAVSELFGARYTRNGFP